MGIYKGVQIPDRLDAVIRHMPEVGGYCEELSSLGQAWDLLSILGQMSGGAAEMAGTREGFRQLTEELLAQLGTETLKKSAQQITSKAQVTVDVIIRNLFERTADIGFLTTDDDVRAFLTGGGSKEALVALVARFREYVAKYSVYHDVVLLDTKGQILARIDEGSGMGQSSDPLVRDALSTAGAYVEVFRRSDLLPHEPAPLIYAYRVTASNDPRSRPLGVLCLCFRFANEMDGIFRNLSEDGDWSILTLLDRHGSVIASSDLHQVPLGASMSLVLDEPFKVIRFAGREYLASTTATRGYQGYMGPGWYGHVLAPLDHVFEPNAARAVGRVDERVLAAVTRNQQMFTSALQRIPADADAVQRELDRAVWNGNIRRDGRARGDHSDSAVRVLLWEISKTGGRTKSVFERSIANLHETVVSSLLSDVEFLASLAVDVMDRNLYERANDCRWWALTTRFRDRLAAPRTAASDQEIAAILQYINGLYTVYANLFVYDRAGTIRAVSNPTEQHHVGRTLSEPWIEATLALNSSQQYTVSPFQATPLYDDRATYIYGAAISGAGGVHVVGGIGIVFDGQPQFAAMLGDALPRDAAGEVLPGCFGVFVEQGGAIVSTTSPDLVVGDGLDIDPALLTLKPGRSASRIVEWRDRYYAVGARSSAGYREYKGGSDSYKNAVTGLVFVPLGDVVRRERPSHPRAVVTAHGDNRSGETVEIATFYVGRQWIGIRAERIVEALGAQRITSVPGGPPALAGLTLFRGRPIPVLSPQALFGGDASLDGTQIVVMDTASGHVGLLVDHLGEIPEIAAERILLNSVAVKEGVVEGIIRPPEGETWAMLLLLVEPSRLYAALLGGGEETLLAQIQALETQSPAA